MSLYEIEIETVDGHKTTLSEYKGKALLIVNVASQCGLTPQYGGLQELYERYSDLGLEVLGFPCNQFGNQEPGTHEEIKTFCETQFSVSFPLFSKIEVNGDSRHPLFAHLTQIPDDTGHDGDIRWNFEKFVVSPQGQVVARFNPTIKPDDQALVDILERNLPSGEYMTIDLTDADRALTNQPARSTMEMGSQSIL